MTKRLNITARLVAFAAMDDMRGAAVDACSVGNESNETTGRMFTTGWRF
ncbi:hypothetical protein IV417_05645 [Alphaproteobacteria bacterium KMM 3653]|uniref:Uncharacterized protein n=1 Tax=Harenicola maris TaxID=2841044 RepID=A0AAP2CM59_9RHOB|nr:hypothetical protein [Harenicola maris]